MPLNSVIGTRINKNIMLQTYTTTRVHYVKYSTMTRNIMNVVLGYSYALVRLYWAGDNLGYYKDMSALCSPVLVCLVGEDGVWVEEEEEVASLMVDVVIVRGLS